MKIILGFEKLLISGKPALRNFNLQLFIIVSAGFGKSTFSYRTGSEFLRLYGNGSKSLAIVESFRSDRGNFGTNFQCAQGTASLECAGTNRGNVLGNGCLFQFAAVFESIRSDGSYFIGFSIGFYRRWNSGGNDHLGIWLL